MIVRKTLDRTGLNRTTVIVPVTVSILSPVIAISLSLLRYLLYYLLLYYLLFLYPYLPPQFRSTVSRKSDLATIIWFLRVLDLIESIDLGILRLVLIVIMIILIVVGRIVYLGSSLGSFLADLSRDLGSFLVGLSKALFTLPLFAPLV